MILCVHTEACDIVPPGITAAIVTIRFLYRSITLPGLCQLLISVSYLRNTKIRPRSLVMHFLSLLNILLLSATAVSSSQVDVVIDDITALDKDVQSLTAKVRAYNGGLIPQVPQLFGLTEVHLATRKGYYSATSLPRPLTEEDGARLIEHVNETLAIDNPIAVQVLESKKPLFDAAGTSPVIKDGLKLLLSDHLAFSNEVLERSPADLLAEANAVVDVISNALQHGINTFS